MESISWLDYNCAPDVHTGSFESEAPEMHVLTSASKFAIE